MDKLDAKILEILSKNSRTSYMKIARNLKISESTVRKRVSNLEKGKVIMKYSLVLDSQKMGFQNIALVGVDVEPEKYLDVSKQLTEIEGIRYVATSTGDHMFMLQVWAKDNDELKVLSDKVKGLPGVTRICPAIIKDTLKGTL